MRKINLLFAALALLCLAPGVYAQYDAVYKDFDRTGWVATAPPLSPVDNEDGVQATAGAQYLLDGNQITYLSMVKPGKTYGNITISPASWRDLYFVIDFPSAQVFDYFRMLYREKNQNEYLRPWYVAIYGSNGTGAADEREWTQIYSAAGQDSIPLPNAPQRGSQFDYEDPIQLTNSTAYTSIKVVYLNGSLSSGSTCQLAEFSLGKVSYDKVIEKPADISFGDIESGQTSTKTLAIAGANLNTAVTYTVSGEDAAAFSVASLGKQTTTADTVNVTFAPAEKKLYTATLTINSEGAVGAQTITLTGNADFTLPVQISSADATNEHWYYIQFARQAINGKALTATADSVKQLPLDSENPAQLWKMVGTWDNYELVSKEGKKLYYDYMPAGQDPETGTTVAERNLFITAADKSDKFGFVRYNSTDSWQLLNKTSTIAPSNRTYLNDYEGTVAGAYTLNNAGNELVFTLDEPGFTIPGDTVKIGAANINTTADFNVVVGGVKLTSGITVALSDDEDGVFTLNTLSLPAKGDTIKLTYAPKAYKDTSYVTITLTSGGVSKAFVAWATSDVGISKYYVSKTQAWGKPVDGDTVSVIPTLKAGDILWLAEGEYEVSQINLPANASVYGGFEGTETSPEQRATESKPWEYTHASVLKNKAALVVSVTGNNTVIDGVTFDGNTGVTGRAIQNTGGYTDGVIRNSIVKNFNSGANDGGGMNIRYRTEIYNCLITGNHSDNKGGGGYFDAAAIHNCEITNNSTVTGEAKPIGSGKGGGGGLFLANATGTVAYNCYVSDNKASFGGGVFVNGSKLYNCVIVNNTATSGSAIAFDERRGASAYNVTVADNHATVLTGAGICFSADGSDRNQELYNAILYNNTDIDGEVYNVGVNNSGAGFAKPVIKNVIIDDAAWYTEDNANLIIENGIDETDGTKLFEPDSYVTAFTSPGRENGIYIIQEEVVNEEIGEVEVPAVYLEFAGNKDFAGGVRVAGVIDIGPYEDQSNVSGIEAPETVDGNVIATKYYNLQGMEVTEPFTTGIYIKKDLLDNGKVRAAKILYSK